MLPSRLSRTRSFARRATRQGAVARAREHQLCRRSRRRSSPRPRRQRSAAPATPIGRVSSEPALNAIRRPSGDQVGRSEVPAPVVVSLRWPLPSAFMTQTASCFEEILRPSKDKGCCLAPRCWSASKLLLPGVHADLRVAVAPAHEGDLLAIGRPSKVNVFGVCVARQPPLLAPVRVYDEDVGDAAVGGLSPHKCDCRPSGDQVETAGPCRRSSASAARSRRRS